MATWRRAQIVEALRVLFAGEEPFPARPEHFSIDAADVRGWRDLPPATGRPALSDTANILPGKFELTIDGGSDDDWEGMRELTLQYAVQGSLAADRVARRDLAVPVVEAVIAANRDLGLGDPQIYAELGPALEEDDAPLMDDAPVSMASIPIRVTYVAASAAG